MTLRTFIALAALLVAPSTRAYHGVVPPAAEQEATPCCAPGSLPCEQDPETDDQAGSPSSPDDLGEPVFTDQG